MTNNAITTRPATPAEIAADDEARRPAHKRTVTVETNADARAVVGRAKTIHRATVTTHLNAHGESVGRVANVWCGAERYRNARSAATAVSSRYDVDCAKCIAAGE